MKFSGENRFRFFVSVMMDVLFLDGQPTVCLPVDASGKRHERILRAAAAPRS